MAKVRRTAGASAGGPRASQHSRSPKRSSTAGQKPYARFREIVFVFQNVAINGGQAVGQTPSLNNDFDITYKRGCTNLSTTNNRTNNTWQIAIEYTAGDKVTTPGMGTGGTALAIASATLGIDGMGGWVDPPLRVRATVQLQVTVQNNTASQLTVCVVLGIREWYFASDAEN
jgi:hypothetical protein